MIIMVSFYVTILNKNFVLSEQRAFNVHPISGDETDNWTSGKHDRPRPLSTGGREHHQNSASAAHD